jgi:hypothetical protein
MKGFGPKNTAPPGGLKDGQPTNMQPPKGDIPAGMADTPLYNTPPKQAPAAKIPEHFANPEKSGLTYTVVKGSQSYNIVLK